MNVTVLLLHVRTVSLNVSFRARGHLVTDWQSCWTKGTLFYPPTYKKTGYARKLECSRTYLT